MNYPSPRPSSLPVGVRIAGIALLITAGACQAFPGSMELGTPTPDASVQSPRAPTTTLSSVEPTSTQVQISTATSVATEAVVLPTVCSAGPAIDPARQEIAFVAAWDGDGEIYTVRADGSALMRVTDNSVDEVAAQWSPTGRLLAYVVRANGGGWELHLLDEEGGFRRLLDAGVMSDAEFSWSPDESRIAFSGIRKVRIVNLNDVSIWDLFEQELPGAGFPTWSPDGGRLAFTHNDGGRVPFYVLYTVIADGTDLRWIDLDGLSVFRAVWHPREDLLLLQAEDGVYQLAVSGGQLSQRNGTPEFFPEAFWAPDGETIAYETIDQIGSFDSYIIQSSLHAVSADGTMDRVVVGPPRDREFIIEEFSWAPDSRHLAYVATAGREGTGEPSNLYVVDMCGGVPRLLAEEVYRLSISWRVVP